MAVTKEKGKDQGICHYIVKETFSSFYLNFHIIYVVRKRKRPTQQKGKAGGNGKPPKKRQKKEGEYIHYTNSLYTCTCTCTFTCIMCVNIHVYYIIVSFTTGQILHVMAYDESAPAAPLVSTQPPTAPAAPLVSTQPPTAPAAPLVSTQPPTAPAAPLVSTQPPTAPAAPLVSTQPPTAPAAPLVSTQPPTAPAVTIVSSQPPIVPAVTIISAQPPTAPILLSSSGSETTSDYSYASSVPPLPPPINNSNVSPIKPPQHSLDSLALEMEVQELMDRVSFIEANQRQILLKQDEIIARLVSLEKSSHVQKASTPYHTPHSFNETSTMDSFSFTSDHDIPMYIPPPPSHPPHRFIRPEPENQTPSRVLQPQNTHGNNNSFSDDAPRRRFILSDVTETSTPLSKPRVPFRPVNTNYNHMGNDDQSKQVHPVRVKPANKPLPSVAINKQKLVSVNDVLMKHPKLRCASKVGTLAVKLAKDAFFGQDVMEQCTVAGERELPGLPDEELQQLKDALFMQFPDYWKTPQEFEPLWKDATAAIGQACKRLRRSKL